MAEPSKKEKIHYTISELNLMVKIIREMAEAMKQYADKVMENIEDMAQSVNEHINDLQRQIDERNNAKR